MADDKKVMVTTGPTFTPEGVLVPPNTPILVSKQLADDDAKNDTQGLAEVPKNWQPPVAVEMAAIGPTGPNPTQPQVLPPGAFQMLGGYAGPDGASIVAETTKPDAQPAAINGGLEVEEGGPATGGDGKDALDGSVTELKTYLEGVNDPAEIDRLTKAEKAGKSRTGALTALDERKQALALS